MSFLRPYFDPFETYIIGFKMVQGSPKDNLFSPSLTNYEQIKWVNIALKFYWSFCFSQMLGSLFIGFSCILEFERNPAGQNHVDFFENGLDYSVHFARLKLTMGGKVEFNSCEFSQEISQICSITDHANDWMSFQPP